MGFTSASYAKPMHVSEPTIKPGRVIPIPDLSPVFASSMILPRSKYFRQVAEYQIGQFSLKLRVLDSQSSSLEYEICTIDTNNIFHQNI